MKLDFPTLNNSDVYAIRSQRDLSLNVSIDQFVQPALNLNTVLLNQLNYTWDTLSNVPYIIACGANRLSLDLYWNRYKQIFQICPYTNETLYSDSDSDGSSELAIFTYENGIHSCNNSLGFTNFLSEIIDDQWIEQTDNNLEASILIITVNLKYAITADIISTTDRWIVSNNAARNINSSAAMFTSMSSLESSAVSDLNASDSIISVSLASMIDSTLGQFTYTPSKLRSDREKSRYTWNDTGASPSGWPLLQGILFNDFYRIIFSYGNLEISENDYNYTADEGMIFNSSYIPYSGASVSYYNTSFSQDELSADAMPVCSINSDDRIYDISSDQIERPSWLLAYDSSFNPFSGSSMQKFMQCAFSPMMNATYSNSSQIVEYITSGLAYGRWSWIRGQPIDITETSYTESLESSTVILRCASLKTDGWVVENCYNKYRVACRVNKEPYTFEISKRAYTYYDAMNACDDNSVFTLPRTALQNTVLQELRRNTVGTDPIWIDMNSLAKPNCWMTVPTVAAVIVLVLVTLTLFSKLRDYRLVKARRKRRRVVKKFGEMEYDGVPS
ncbi:hypothetical protein V1511DRAFT_522940 [Dipodascopsis uninucleata]